MTSGPKEHRSSRFQAGLPATVEVDGRDFDCVAHNLSRTGTLLAGQFPPPAAPEIRLTLRSPAGDLRLSLAARGVRCEASVAAGGTELAVEFVAVSSVERETLEALIARVIEGQTPAALEGLPDDATPQQIRAALGKVPLAHRIQLALRAQAKERALMMHDPHPQVIDAVARNPHVLRQEILALLRMPLLLPHTIEAIAKDPRWTGSEEIAVLVVTHRNTPQPTAERILAGMPPSSLQKVIQASGLSPALREKVLKRLPRR
jgi:hypothetical protein